MCVLAAAGASYQTLFRNPLVSPDILGVSAGAGLGAVLGTDDCVYGIPCNAERVLRIDPATDATELIGDDLSAHGEGSPPPTRDSPGALAAIVPTAAPESVFRSCVPRGGGASIW